MMYLGPYLVCQNQEAIGSQECRTCSNPLCEKYEGAAGYMAKFCYHCGSPIQGRQVAISTRRVNSHKLEQQLENRLHCVRRIYEPVRDLWITSKNDGCSLRVQREVRPFDWDEMQQWFQSFQTLYEKEIEAITEAYGDDNVEIFCGIVS